MTDSPPSSASTSPAGTWAPENLTGSPVRAWIVAAGLFRGFLIVSLAPASLGALLAWQEGAAMRPGVFAWVLLCVWAYHVGANLLNEVYDYESGADRVNEVRTPYSGGTRVLVCGALAPGPVRAVALGALCVGLAGFLALSARVGWWLMVFASFGFLSPILYSVRPFWFAYRGFGELLLGLTFGPALVGCAYFALAGSVSPGAWIVGVSTGLLAAAVLTINEIPDREADAATGKRNLVARFGAAAGFRILSVLALVGAALPIAAVLAGRLPLTYLAALLPTALAARIVVRGRSNYGSVEAMTKASAQTIGVYVSAWLAGAAAIVLARVIG